MSESKKKMNFWEEICATTENKSIRRFMFGFRTSEHEEKCTIPFGDLKHVIIDDDFFEELEELFKSVDAFDFKDLGFEAFKVYTDFRKVKYTKDYVAIKKTPYIPPKVIITTMTFMIDPIKQATLCLSKTTTRIVFGLYPIYKGS